MEEYGKNYYDNVNPIERVKTPCPAPMHVGKQRGTDTWRITHAYTCNTDHPCSYVSTPSPHLYPFIASRRRLQSSRHSFIGLRARAEKREISIRRPCRDKMNFVA